MIALITIESNEMKKITLTTSLALMILFSFGQVINFKAYSVAHTEMNVTTEQWTDWTPWQEVDIHAVLDFDNNIIKILSEPNEVYGIIEFVGNFADEDGDDTFEWYCVNDEDLRCSIRLINRISNGTTSSSFYIDFSNYRTVYLVYLIE
jgi:hypothetical protein